MQLKGSTCEICGKAVLSKRGTARFCQDKSTCRVSYYRKQKEARAQADRMTVDMTTYALYESVIALAPNVKGTLDLVLNQHGKEIFSMTLVIASQAMSGAMLSQGSVQNV